MENGGLELGDHPGGLCGTDLGGLMHLVGQVHHPTSIMFSMSRIY